MMTWLMRMHPDTFDGLYHFQMTGRPIPALIAIALPILRHVAQPRKHRHA